MRTVQANRCIALATWFAMTLGSLSRAARVEANSKTWKKATIGAGAVTAYGLLAHNGKATTLGAIATAGSYLMYRKQKKSENNRRRRHHHYRRHHR